MPKKTPNSVSAGVIHLFLLLIIAAALIIGVVYLVAKGTIKTPLTKTQSKLELQTGYNNPFDKNAQYVNPFSDYKNPIDNLKQ